MGKSLHYPHCSVRPLLIFVSVPHCVRRAWSRPPNLHAKFQVKPNCPWPRTCICTVRPSTVSTTRTTTKRCGCPGFWECFPTAPEMHQRQCPFPTRIRDCTPFPSAAQVGTFHPPDIGAFGVSGPRPLQSMPCTGMESAPSLSAPPPPRQLVLFTRK